VGFFERPRLMPAEHFADARRAERSTGEAGRARVVADYIAGMTDRYAEKEDERLTG
jgi:dGTPase